MSGVGPWQDYWFRMLQVTLLGDGQQILSLKVLTQQRLQLPNKHKTQGDTQQLINLLEWDICSFTLHLTDTFVCSLQKNATLSSSLVYS